VFFLNKISCFARNDFPLVREPNATAAELFRGCMGDHAGVDCVSAQTALQRGAKGAPGAFYLNQLIALVLNIAIFLSLIKKQKTYLLARVLCEICICGANKTNCFAKVFIL